MLNNLNLCIILSTVNEINMQIQVLVFKLPEYIGDRWLVHKKKVASVEY